MFPEHINTAGNDINLIYCIKKVLTGRIITVEKN